MKRVVAGVFLVLLSAGIAFAEENKGYDEKLYPCKQAVVEEVGARGCCSWHGGVCGCESGRVVCCDGQYSPSCSCRAQGGMESRQGEVEKVLSDRR